MSNHPRRQPDTRRAFKRKSMLRAVRIIGCICEPNLVHSGPDRFRVEHDDWCPMIGHGPQIVIAFPDRCDR